MKIFFYLKNSQLFLQLLVKKNKIALSNEERPTTYNFLSTARRQKTVFFFKENPSKMAGFHK